MVGTCVALGTSVSGPAMPHNARLYFNDVAHRYASPPCVEEARLSGDDRYLRYTRVGVYADRLNKSEGSREARYRGEEHCREMGGFINEEADRSMPRYLLERLGILSKPTSRWETDGSWRW